MLGNCCLIKFDFIIKYTKQFILAKLICKIIFYNLLIFYYYSRDEQNQLSIYFRSFSRLLLADFCMDILNLSLKI